MALGLNEPVRIADQVLATQETIRAVAQSYSRKASFHHELKIFLSFDYLTVEDDPTELSDGGSHFIEGILQHGPALSVISSPSLLQKCDKKIRIGWATNRQNVTLRVFHDGFSQCLNLEYRLCDMSNCNIYLVLAIFLACGINGIDEKIVLRPSCDEQEDVSFSDQMIESLELDNFVMQQMGPVIGEKYLTHLQKEKNFGIGCQQMMDDI